MDVLALAPHWGPGMWWPVFPAFWILAERYARGEMSSDEYFEHTSVLRGGVS